MYSYLKRQIFDKTLQESKQKQIDICEAPDCTASKTMFFSSPKLNCQEEEVNAEGEGERNSPC